MDIESRQKTILLNNKRSGAVIVEQDFETNPGKSFYILLLKRLQNKQNTNVYKDNRQEVFIRIWNKLKAKVNYVC